MSARPVTGIEVHGAGPAGSAASIAARLAGAEVDLYDPSPFPRQKVCGEFLSPEAIPVLESLGVADAFAALKPARYSHLVLNFGERPVRSHLPAPAYGISRYALDNLLLQRALQLGARLHRERGPASTNRPTIVAHGRHPLQAPPRGQRLFGFKAHYGGSPADPLALFFTGESYLGMNVVENGVTNICGLAQESQLRRYSFDVDAYLDSHPSLRSAVRPLTRSTSWMITGPLVYNQRFHSFSQYWYPAGDALSFVDPFTGSGMLVALITGHLAGTSAANSISSAKYLQFCRHALHRPFRFASFFRIVLSTQFADVLARIVPAKWLVQATRPAAFPKSFKM